MPNLANDNYGRSVSVVTINGHDIYTISTNSVTNFIIDVPTGTSQASVYSSINAMAPSALVLSFIDATFSLTNATHNVSYENNIGNYVNNASLITSMSASNLPAWIVFDETTGAIEGTPALSDVGTAVAIVFTLNGSILGTASIQVL